MQKSEVNMPSHYRLLTLVAFHVFLEEKVSVPSCLYMYMHVYMSHDCRWTWP